MLLKCLRALNWQQLIDPPWFQPSAQPSGKPAAHARGLALSDVLRRRLQRQNSAAQTMEAIVRHDTTAEGSRPAFATGGSPFSFEKKRLKLKDHCAYFNCWKKPPMKGDVVAEKGY